ncbi:hypothetical protein DICTH_1840 [Dictyoglomus thermophilum H-6-12]|uniref:Uncharacterized protein n=1 Tax=Dictyoglomus thermophilum (strain ATCC 35947 / DSM 3960 / H-6-12) TaxID=309799 RepID=B5YBN0_DICT6|nr:hypothetical protein DICTH_1840 [Dictyoglomus thermophilum H-6-12]
MRGILIFSFSLIISPFNKWMYYEGYHETLGGNPRSTGW